VCVRACVVCVCVCGVCLCVVCVCMCVCVNVVEDRFVHKHVDFQGQKKSVEGTCVT
jgi:hypothetical protein